MRDGGDIELDVYIMPYTQFNQRNGSPLLNGDDYSQLNFLKSSVEPVLTTTGEYRDPKSQALSPFDYGLVRHGFNTSQSQVAYNGGSLGVVTATDHAPEVATLQFANCELPPYGSNVGNILYPDNFVDGPLYNADAVPPGDGYVNAVLPIGPSTLFGSDFVLPYCQYDYYTLYAASKELGIVLSGGYGNMVNAYSKYNIGFNNNPTQTNSQGTFVCQGEWPTAWFLPWDNYSLRPFNFPINPPTNTVDIYPPDDPLIADIFNNERDPSGSGTTYIQNAFNFFIFMAGPVFAGQPQTPVLYDPVLDEYHRVKLTGHSSEANLMISQESGLDVAYSEQQSTYYFVNNNNVPELYYLIFFTTVLKLELTLPAIPAVPKLSFPCYGVQAPRTFLKR